MIYIFTKKSSALQNVFPKDTVFATWQLSKHLPSSSDITYVDISGFSGEEAKKMLVLVKKICNDTPWGIIDPKGNVRDPALLFIEGASDYLGQGYFKDDKKIDAKRTTAVSAWRKVLMRVPETQDVLEPISSEDGFLKSGVKLPAANTFPGWKKMQSVKALPFYLLYCSLQGKTALDMRLQEKALANVYRKFHSILTNNFKEGDAQLWMDSGKDCLFLLPPKSQCVSSVIGACISLILAAPQIVMESFGLNIPANFIFALHYGMINYKPPGKTGTVVSDAVNSIFHLGSRKAEAGRLTVTGDLPDASIPAVLQDMFSPCGEFEGRKIWHSKKFFYAKQWM